MTRNLSIGLLMLAFVLGICLGLGLGWQVWPVKWYDTDPADLRLQHQENWLRMTADSLAVTGDVKQAQARLEQLTNPDNPDMQRIANLAEQVAQAEKAAGNGDQATRIRNMASMTGLPTPTAADLTLPRPEPFLFASWLGYLLLGLGLLVLVAAGIVWVIFRRNRSLNATFDNANSPTATPSASQSASTSQRPAVTAKLSESAPYRGAARPDRPPFGQTATVAYATSGAYQSTVARSTQERELTPTFTNQEEARTPDRPASPALFLGTFRAEYRLGERDFDRSFSVEDSEKEVIGDCGMVSADVMEDDTSQKVDAFRIWLYEVGERGSQQEVDYFFLSEYANQAEAIRGKLAPPDKIAIARPNLSITLETSSLKLVATVVDVEYGGDDLAPNSYFSRLIVEFRMERKRAA